ncbi:MAG TPA: hypothetical protein PKH94_06055 [Bacteroidales bacterium]|nr:hypothetical protein [Bacteroidales bacterium]HNS46783.1 hypothetical protein [Bacteroidales bacterium]
MKALVLTVLGVLFLGMTSGFSSVIASGDTTNKAARSVDCAVYISKDGLVTFRMVKSPGDAVRVGFYDAEGTLLADRKFKKINSVKLSYDLNDCPGGLYEIRVRSGSEVVFSESVVNPQAGLVSQ